MTTVASWRRWSVRASAQPAADESACKSGRVGLLLSAQRGSPDVEEREKEVEPRREPADGSDRAGRLAIDEFDADKFAGRTRGPIERGTIYRISATVLQCFEVCTNL